MRSLLTWPVMVAPCGVSFQISLVTGHKCQLLVCVAPMPWDSCQSLRRALWLCSVPGTRVSSYVLQLSQQRSCEKLVSPSYRHPLYLGGYLADAITAWGGGTSLPLCSPKVKTTSSPLSKSGRRLKAPPLTVRTCLGLLLKWPRIEETFAGLVSLAGTSPAT